VCCSVLQWVAVRCSESVLVAEGDGGWGSYVEHEEEDRECVCGGEEGGVERMWVSFAP